MSLNGKYFFNHLFWMLRRVHQCIIIIHKIHLKTLKRFKDSDWFIAIQGVKKWEKHKRFPSNQLYVMCFMKYPVTLTHEVKCSFHAHDPRIAAPLDTIGFRKAKLNRKPSRINMSPKHGTISKGQSIFQPLICRGYCRFQGCNFQTHEYWKSRNHRQFRSDISSPWNILGAWWQKNVASENYFWRWLPKPTTVALCDNITYITHDLTKVSTGII